MFICVENASRGIVGVRMSDGLSPVAFRQILEKLIRPRVAIKNQQEVVGAMEFEYTFWAKPDNRTAVRQNLIDVRTLMTSSVEGVVGARRS